MRVYISSTYEDLKTYRKAAMDAILQIDYHPIGMEHDVATDKRPLDVCLERLASCQIYVGIIAWRYGFIHPERGLSMTELEYREAERLSIPRLVFIVDENFSWPPKWVEKDQEKFVRFREDACKDYVKSFTNEESLKTELIAALNRHERGQRNQQIIQAAKPKPPKLLPYLPDRVDQEVFLAKSLKSSKPAKPCVFIVHGNEDQSHPEFLERLRNVTLPKMIHSLCGSLSKDLPLSLHSIHWVGKMHEKISFSDQFSANISNKVFNRLDLSPEEINRRLANNSAITIFDTHILSEDCLQNLKTPFELFLNFWAEWPELSTNQHLMVFLFIKYELKKKSNFLIRNKYKQLNNKIRSHIKNLDVAAYEINGTVLPELGNITRRHCEDWARDETVREFLDNGEAKVRVFFDNWEKQHHQTEVSMDTIGTELQKWLSEQWQTHK